MGTFEIFLKRESGIVSVIEVPESFNVAALKGKIQHHCGPYKEQFQIMFNGIMLDSDHNRCLVDLGVRDHSTVFLKLSLCGGINPLLAARNRICREAVKEVVPLPGYITVTHKPDMISLDDDPNVNRAKMPCGHVIGCYEMTEFCRSSLSEGKHSFRCPASACDREWPYFLVRHVACLTRNERKQIEAKISENYLMFNQGFQKCPSCGTWCLRADETSNCVRCLLCSKTSDKVYDFCWNCLNQWRTKGDVIVCGNSECTGVDSRLKYLQECGKKRVNGVRCRSVRACPKCGMLIEHKAACKHMTCSGPACKYQFCFICLKPWGNCGGWDSTCTPAHVQRTFHGAASTVDQGADHRGTDSSRRRGANYGHVRNPRTPGEPFQHDRFVPSFDTSGHQPRQRHGMRRPRQAFVQDEEQLTYL